jgi:hypothetical protein
VVDTPDRTSLASGSGHPGPPEGKVIGSVAATAVEAVTAALAEAGFAADTIDVVSRDELEDLEAPIDRPGLRGLVNRFIFSLGDDLDELERARQELQDGRILIGVPVQDEEAMHRAAGVFRVHGSTWVTHFGRWTIRSL